MKIKETIERECCDFDKDLKPIDERDDYYDYFDPFEDLKLYRKTHKEIEFKENIPLVYICIHCGQLWHWVNEYKYYNTRLIKKDDDLFEVYYPDLEERNKKKK